MAILFYSLLTARRCLKVIDTNSLNVTSDCIAYVLQVALFQFLFLVVSLLLLQLLMLNFVFNENVK